MIGADHIGTVLACVWEQASLSVPTLNAFESRRNNIIINII